ncbi:MAG: hypothetical protein M1820_002543 [Bogoriella megaspora]|nr:MAG: hypothetical protein M1820_002543 [Bogoriella megaspora]
MDQPPPASEVDLDILLESSPWTQRAWCYQEKVLSHRLILFTRRGVFMQCQEGSYDATGAKLQITESKTANFDQKRKRLIEDISGQKGQFNRSVFSYDFCGGMLRVPLDHELDSYLSAVEYYSRRKLTKPEDKSNAFQGIFRLYRGRIDTSLEAGVRQVSYKNDEVSREIRKPASKSNWPGVPEDDRFGFPAAEYNTFYTSAERRLLGSMTDLSISNEPLDTGGSNGCYSLFPIWCTEQPAPPSMIDSVYEAMQQSKLEMSEDNAEVATPPSVLAIKQTKQGYDAKEHEQHIDCEAQTPIGYIWLNRSWREQQTHVCIMTFLALAGDRNPEDPGKWTITMLMLLQSVTKDGIFGPQERIHVMDCSIKQELWIKAGARVDVFLIV